MKLIKILQLLRPKQWIKNLFIFAPILFSGLLTDLSVLVINIEAFIAFCLVSSAVYVINDIADVEADRTHKKKRFRPIASGDVSIPEARVVFVILLALAIAICTIMNVKFIIAIALYFVINVLYTSFVKNIVLLDVFFISFGFMLRVAAGAFAIDVQLSSWMILTTIFISLFLGISKRRAELSQSDQENIPKQRKVLEQYSVAFTDQMNTIAATGTIISYALYTVSERAVEAFHSDNLIYTTPFVIYGIFRYMYLIHKKNLGESPTQIVTKDPAIIINSVLWFLISFAIIYKSKFGL